MTLWRFLRRFLIALALGYVAYGAVMIAIHPRYIYPFVSTPFGGQGYETARVAVAGADPLPVEMFRGDPGAPVVVYFMGNVGALNAFLAMLDHHKAAGRSVVAMTYRGGGGVPGESSETSLKRDALAVVDALPDLGFTGPVVAQGYSLGTGLALHAAANRDLAGVLLSAPYTRMCTLMARASYLPACQLPFVQKWQSIDIAAQVGEPVLILHGTGDTLIAPHFGRELADALPRAAFVPVNGAGHADLIHTPGYLSAVDAFLDGGFVLPPA
ncbi:MAG: alpha/beta hydrolase [Marinibacterium sp.]